MIPGFFDDFFRSRFEWAEKFYDFGVKNGIFMLLVQFFLKNVVGLGYYVYLCCR